MGAIRLEQKPHKLVLCCPFCTGVARLYVHELAGVPELEPYYQVACDDCGATGPARDDPFSAVDWWNRASRIKLRSLELESSTMSISVGRADEALQQELDAWDALSDEALRGVDA